MNVSKSGNSLPSLGCPLYLPFPASTHLGSLLHSSPSNLGARDTPGTMPFARNDIHQRRKEYLINKQARLEKTRKGIDKISKH